MKRRKRTVWIVALALVALLGGGAADYYLRLRPTAQPQAQASLRTTRAFRGDMVISATGAGTVIPASQRVLGFASSGTIEELNVDLGSLVEAGDVLARIDDLEARRAVSSAQAQVLSAESALADARQAYDDLAGGRAEAELLQAQATVLSCQQTLADLQAGPSESDLAAAQAAVLSAEEAYNRLANSPDADELEQQELALAQAKNSLWAAQMGRDAKGTDEGKASGAYDQAQASVLNGEIAVELAEMALADLQEPATAVEVQQARATLLAARQTLADLEAGATEAETVQAKAELALAEQALADVQAGTSKAATDAAGRTVRQAEASLEDATLALEAARAALAECTLVAPFGGTVTAVTATVGEGASADLITLAAAGQPRLEVYLDETDMDQVAVGYEAEVVLESKPDLTFTGAVVRVEPSLVTTNGVSAVRAVVELAPDSFAKPQSLLLGMNATVDVIGGRAQGAVLVPVEALREIDADEYGVFVVEGGTLRFRIVTVGLTDMTYAEITAGLQAGETVSTGMVETA